MDILPQDGADTSGANKTRITTRFLTKYERARILGTRALQIRYVALAWALASDSSDGMAHRLVGSPGGFDRPLPLASHTNPPPTLHSMNAPIMVKPGNETDPLKIAMMELRARKIPIIIRRYLPDGSHEDWSIDELEIPGLDLVN